MPLYKRKEAEVWIRSFAIRLYPSKEQELQLNQMLETCRRFYNDILRYKQWRQATDNPVDIYELKRQIPQRRADNQYLQCIYQNALQELVRRLDTAYVAAYRRLALKKAGKLRADEEVGFPKFIKYGEFRSIIFPAGDGGCKLISSQVRIFGVGDIKHRADKNLPENGKIKTSTLQKKAGEWYVKYVMEIPKQEVTPSRNPAIGLDMGCSALFTDNQGNKLAHPRFYRKSQEKRAVLQQRQSRCKKGSCQHKKLKHSIAMLDHHVANQRRDFHHKVSHSLVSSFGLIAHEDLAIANMVRRPKPKQDETGKFIPNGASRKSGLNKSILDAGWGNLIFNLTYKAEEHGVTVIKVPAAYSSQECSKCGHRQKIPLSMRTYDCEECENAMERDTNSANIVLSRALSQI